MRKVLLGTVLLMSLFNNLEVSLAEVEILPDQTLEELKLSTRRLTKDEIYQLHEIFSKSPNLTEELEQLQKEMNDHLNRG